MPLSAVAIVPAAPLLLVGASPAQPQPYAAVVEEARAAVAKVLGALPDGVTAMLLLADDEALVIDASRASLASYGMPGVEAGIQVDRELLSAVSARGQAPRVRSDRLDGDAAVLALLLAEHRPGTPVAPVTLPRGASQAGLAGMAIGLAGAIQATGHGVVVIAAGDLAATLDVTSPGYRVEGAQAWDCAALAAIEGVDADAFGQLGPDEAQRVQARGWAPITVALRLARSTGAAFGEVTYLAPKGVGQIIAG